MGNIIFSEEKKDPVLEAIRNKEPKNIIIELLKNADLEKKDEYGISYTKNLIINGYQTDVLKHSVKSYKEDISGRYKYRDEAYDTSLNIALKRKLSDNIIKQLVELNKELKAASTKLDGNIRRDISYCKCKKPCSCTHSFYYLVEINFDLSYEASTHFLAKEMGYSEEILSLLETTYKERRYCDFNSNIY